MLMRLYILIKMLMEEVVGINPMAMTRIMVFNKACRLERVWKMTDVVKKRRELNPE